MQSGVQQGGFLRRGLLLWGLLALCLAYLIYSRTNAQKGPEVEVSGRMELLRATLVRASNYAERGPATRELLELVSPEARLRVAGIPSEERGSAGLLRLLSKTQVEGVTLEVQSKELALSTEGTSARAFLHVLATGKSDGATRITVRRVHLRFEKYQREWRLVDLEVLPEARNYPEARP